MADVYRLNAGIVVFNRQRKVLLCRRNDVADAWQFPQGGIEVGEMPAEAALRELKEETSLENVVPVKTLEKPVRYDFPPQILTKMQQCGYKNIGQEMYWTLAFFGGSDTQINLNTNEAEFADFRWDSFENACTLVVDFKKAAYKYAYDEFIKLITDYNI